mgnify:CR=1 FL=1
MQWFHRTVELLRQHFDKIRLRRPLPKNEIAALQLKYGAAADALSYFYSQTNGLYIGIRDYDLGRIFSFEESQKLASLFSHMDSGFYMFPVRGDGCGDYDCLVVGGTVAEGSVVFVDHEVAQGPAYLLAGSFASYFQIWADYLTTKYHANGDIDQRYVSSKLDAWPWLEKPQRQHPWPFDEEWLKVNDEKAAQLLDDPSIRAWLIRQNDLP